MSFFDGFADELNKLAQPRQREFVVTGLLGKGLTSEKPKTLKGGHIYRNTGDPVSRKIPSEGISRTMRENLERKGLSHTIVPIKKHPGPHPRFRKYIPGIVKGWR